MTIPSGFSQISVIHVGGGIVDEAMWTLGVDNDAGQTPAEIAEDVVGFLDVLNYEDMISTSVDVTEVRVKNGPDNIGPSGTFPAGITGNIGGNAAPPNLALLVHKLTALGGRQGRGRLFVPGLAEAELEADGMVSGGTASSFQTFFDNLLISLSVVNLPAVLLHGDALTPTALTALTVDQKLATQRRRLRR